MVADGEKYVATLGGNDENHRRDNDIGDNNINDMDNNTNNKEIDNHDIDNNHMGDSDRSDHSDHSDLDDTDVESNDDYNSESMMQGGDHFALGLQGDARSEECVLGYGRGPPFAYKGAGLVAETVKVTETVMTEIAKVAETATRA